MTVSEICKKAKDNAQYPARLPSAKKNLILGIVADSLILGKSEILEANKRDLEANQDQPAYILDRMTLNEERIEGIKAGIMKIADIPDPVGKTVDSFVTADGLLINKVTVPIGVVGIIYEARPNVTLDVIAICIKTGNAVVLKGSSQANETNRTIVATVKRSLRSAGINPEFIQYIDDVSHEAAQSLMKQNEYVDVLIPRGSARFIKEVKDNSTIPTIETGAGNCHIYVHEKADPGVLSKILMNGKLQRQSVCNALESIVCDVKAAFLLPPALEILFQNNVQIYGCEKTIIIYPKALPASDEDFYTEYLGPKISCKIVNGIAEAIDFINEHSTHHSEVIVSEDKDAVSKFLAEIDSACVYANASTRFTDGFMFGFGAEMGISTQKLHARGPVGPEQLVSYKYQITGSGQCRK